MPDNFTERVRKRADPIWEAQQRHPFIVGLGDGTLESSKFEFWVRQDYLFLIESARFLGLAAARSPDLEAMSFFANLAHTVVASEMDLQRSFAQVFGISAAELENEPKAPVTQGYTDFLLRHACLADFEVLIGSLLPGLWCFSEIGQRLAERPPPADERYLKWIEMHADEAFVGQAEQCRLLLDRWTTDLPEGRLRSVEEAFLIASRYEWLFLDMAWNQAHWPL
ncbi:MAG: thiaminase II [Gemmataceae bacterium]